MSSFFTVIKFTFSNRFKSRSFIYTTIILALIISLGINLPFIIESFSSGQPKKIGVITDQSEVAAKLEEYFTKQEKPKLKMVILPDLGSQEANEKKAIEELTYKNIKAFLQFTNDDKSTFPKVTYKALGSLDQSEKAMLQMALQSIKTQLAVQNAGLNEEQKLQLFAPISLEDIQISIKEGGAAAVKTEEERAMAYIMVYVLLVLLFMIVQMYGGMIASEVTAEKSSRVMELLISSVSPLRQMFGKVIGMFLLGLSQMCLFAVIVGLNLFLPHNKEILTKHNLKFSDIPPNLFVYFIIFFLLGFFMYAILYAMVGSLISRTEDLQQAILPVTLLMLASFYIGIFGIQTPSATFITAMSFVPFFTPLIMFLRIGLVDLPFWQVVLSIAVLLASILCLGWLAVKIYRVGVLMYGKRPTIREVMKAMKAFKV